MMRMIPAGLAVAAVLSLMAGCEQQSEPERPVTEPGGEMAPLEVEPATEPAQEQMDLYQPGGAQQPAASAPQAQETEQQEEVLTTPEPMRPDNSGDGGAGEAGTQPPAL